MYNTNPPAGGERVGGILVFVVSFLAFLHAAPPTLPPYRDAGEMAVSAWTLGVSHPPSYPLYALSGHAALDLIPWGDPAWRLILLSALASSLLLALVVGLWAPRLGTLPALAGAGLLAANTTLWSVSLVPEMYSLTLLFALILLELAWRSRDGGDRRVWDAFCLLYGLFLGNRTDLLLWAPGLLWLSRRHWEEYASREGKGRVLVRAAALGALGLSIYLYLPLRSAQNPWLDWNHPASLGNLIGSLTRRSYGGTLDTLSKSYAFGELFADNLAVYGRHLWKDYMGPFVLLPAVGILAWFRRDRDVAISAVLLYAASGPLFLLLANLPPNPHAMAIVEPHYLLSDLVLALAAARGIAALREALPRAAWAVLAGLLVLPWSWGGRWERVRRRASLAAHEWSRNVQRSTPRGAVLVSKKDVQLFTLWYQQAVRGRRPDLRLVAQGLSGSPWYRARRADGVSLGPLRDREDWSRFLALNGDVHATLDVELPDSLPGTPLGLVLKLAPPTAQALIDRRLLIRPGRAYERQPDYFHSDLVESHSLALQRAGVRRIEREGWEEGVALLRSAWSFKWLLPEAPTFIGYALFRMGRLTEAGGVYEQALRLYETTLGLAALYRSLPEVPAALRRGKAEAHLNLGVIRERDGDKSSADGHYRQAIELKPDGAQAHYNRAVLHWGGDWGVVVRELEEVLRLDPGRGDAARYLAQARSRAEPERPVRDRGMRERDGTRLRIKTQ